MKISVFVSILISTLLLSISLIMGNVNPAHANSTLPPGCVVGANIYSASNLVRIFSLGDKIVRVGRDWILLSFTDNGREIYRWASYSSIDHIWCQ